MQSNSFPGSAHGHTIVTGHECSTIETESGGMIMTLKPFTIKILIFTQIERSSFFLG